MQGLWSVCVLISACPLSAGPGVRVRVGVIAGLQQGVTAPASSPCLSGHWADEWMPGPQLHRESFSSGKGWGQGVLSDLKQQSPSWAGSLSPAAY